MKKESGEDYGMHEDKPLDEITCAHFEETMYLLVDRLMMMVLFVVVKPLLKKNVALFLSIYLKVLLVRPFVLKP